MQEIAAVDDELHALRRIEELVKQNRDLKLVGGYRRAKDCLTEIKEGKITPGVVLLDIEMPDYNGLELAQMILEIDEEIDIVFITAYESYAVEAFEINALDYLLKPITADRFQETISRLLNKRETQKTRESRLEVVTLGQVDFLYQGEELNLEWPTVKTKELFLYLLHRRGNFVASDKITEALWPNKVPKKSADILYTTVYNLRKSFKSFGFDRLISSKRGYYKLNKKLVKWDVIEFERLVAEINKSFGENIGQIKDIIRIYRGEYLAEEAYNWVYSLQAELKKEFKKICLKAADYYIEEGKFDQAINILEKVIKEDFLAESAHKKLINIYKMKGNEAAARRQYERLKSRLQKEFGIEPQIEF